jgi:hypothetical protein
MRLLFSSVVALLSVLLVTCTWNETHVRCSSSAECSAGQYCYRSYCVIGDAGVLTATQPEQPQRTQVGNAGAAPPQRTSEMTTCEAAGALDTSAGGACCSAATSCYDGPDGTLGVGACKSGMRACVDGKFADCAESVLPQAESCANQGADDDCDGQVDNIQGRGETCILSSGFGSCGEGHKDCVDGMDTLGCVRAGPTPAESCNHEDEDCDGQIDEGFDISTDRANCGTCGTACSGTELCCGGACIAMSAASASGCPSCGTEHPCAKAASCCGGACRDLERDRRHCGACGHSCEQGERCCKGACKSDCGS